MFFLVAQQGLGEWAWVSVPAAAEPVSVLGSFAAACLWLQLELCIGNHHKHSRSANCRSKYFPLLFLTMEEDLVLASLCLSFPPWSQE